LFGKEAQRPLAEAPEGQIALLNEQCYQIQALLSSDHFLRAASLDLLIDLLQELADLSECRARSLEIMLLDRLWQRWNANWWSKGILWRQLLDTQSQWRYTRGDAKCVHVAGLYAALLKETDDHLAQAGLANLGVKVILNHVHTRVWANGEVLTLNAATDIDIASAWGGCWMLLSQ